MQHSKVVGGSTAKRVINCPGSVPLVAKMPPQIGSKDAAKGTLLHNVISEYLDNDAAPLSAFLGRREGDQVVTEDDIEFKLKPALHALEEIDPALEMRFVTEARVEFEGVKALEGVFGSTDMVGRIGNRAVILDWKFGDGVMVDAEENAQGLFYAAAAKKTSGLRDMLARTTEVEIVIVQPPHVRRWVTTWARVDEFERELINAVRVSQEPDAPLAIGDWCRWCTAKPICPQMNGSIDRVVHTALKDIDSAMLGEVLARADALESFISDARALAFARLEKGMPVAGYKLVPKRATRQWADESAAAAALISMGLKDDAIRKLLSPAQAEAALKQSKQKLPSDLVVAVSSGNTIAPESDPRPAVMVLGEQLRAALVRVQ